MFGNFKEILTPPFEFLAPTLIVCIIDKLSAILDNPYIPVPNRQVLPDHWVFYPHVIERLILIVGVGNFEELLLVLLND